VIDSPIAFFEQYNKLEEKEFRSSDTCSPKDAMTLVKKAMKAFGKKH
jgi:hypothetical protein